MPPRGEVWPRRPSCETSRKGTFDAFLNEAGERLAALDGDPAAKPALTHLPVVLVAYSGGYLPAAYALAVGGAGERVRGVVLLDALYGEVDKFAAWVAQRRPPAFFFSAYSDSSRSGNEALKAMLAQAGVAVATGAGPDMSKGAVTFLDAGAGIDHGGFVTQAWVADPLRWVLARIRGYARKGR